MRTPTTQAGYPYRKTFLSMLDEFRDLMTLEEQRLAWSGSAADRKAMVKKLMEQAPITHITPLFRCFTTREHLHNTVAPYNTYSPLRRAVHKVCVRKENFPLPTPPLSPRPVSRRPTTSSAVRSSSALRASRRSSPRRRGPSAIIYSTTLLL